MTPVIGIDPGASGGFAVLDGTAVQAFPWFSLEETRDELERFKNLPGVTAFLEDAHSSPQMGPRVPPSGRERNFGEWLGLLGAYRISTRLVKPQVWQHGISGLSGTQGQTRKQLLKSEAARRWPRVHITFAIADALLIADWGRRQQLAKEQ